jgi:N-hydroxyarylamine O-acetyltransferase
MSLSDYLKRIGFTGTARPDLATLRAMHRAHAHTVPFENLDVQLRRPVSLSTDAIYEKVVIRRRGGWCYELNGLMCWALREIGFDVTRMSAGVMRIAMGDVQLGNHLCLLVRIDRPYLVDIGFGSSMIEPVALEHGNRDDAPYQLDLAETEDGYWRFTEHVRGAPFSFDFKAVPADESVFAAKCEYLQTNAASPFVQNLVVQRRVDDSHLSLRGRVFTRTDALDEEKRILESAEELVACLRERFDLDVPEVAQLWPTICARHEVVFGRPEQ